VPLTPGFDSHDLHTAVCDACLLVAGITIKVDGVPPEVPFYSSFIPHRETLAMRLLTKD